jgi:hypothetical protein
MLFVDAHLGGVMAKPAKRVEGPGHMREISAVLQAGQMPKALTPASLPDIDVTPAIDAARSIADVAIVQSRKLEEHPTGRGKTEKPPKRK